MDEISARLVRIIRENVKTEEKAEENILNNDLRSLNINSLNFIKIIVAIEEEFDIEFEDEQINFELFGKVDRLSSVIREKIETQ